MTIIESAVCRISRTIYAYDLEAGGFLYTADACCKNVKSVISVIFGIQTEIFQNTF